MLGAIVLFTYDEVISVITLMSEEYKTTLRVMELAAQHTTPTNSK